MSDTATLVEPAGIAAAETQTRPPTELPYDDGDKMESSWHADAGSIIKASAIAANHGDRSSYYVANGWPRPSWSVFAVKTLTNKLARWPKPGDNGSMHGEKSASAA